MGVISLNLHTTLILIIAILNLYFLTTSCLNQNQPSETLQGLLLVEEKTRLGSTPPRCYNKCNYCHPCMAVEVPPKAMTKKKNDDVHQVDDHQPTIPIVDYSDTGNRYSNYKPLGWKCICHGHLYNP